ncbi:uncharacterized protein LY79DRAFT_305187 [Colletotrichum navitas]|uniref:Uncharacterized protein n=1 Tax=Colletotrichum navitas TaxID=681940 RepID=A0AAD8PUU3_9PEZI|nr:uncharacterized protein LY79DRAFT_305187 [Colletotrichum navitas]KAK1580382.1 hypothetical protein LY79DRAFT_305187 [Colletotrichum navitas]
MSDCSADHRAPPKRRRVSLLPGTKSIQVQAWAKFADGIISSFRSPGSPYPVYSGGRSPQIATRQYTRLRRRRPGEEERQQNRRQHHIHRHRSTVGPQPGPVRHPVAGALHGRLPRGSRRRPAFRLSLRCCPSLYCFLLTYRCCPHCCRLPLYLSALLPTSDVIGLSLLPRRVLGRPRLR